MFPNLRLLFLRFFIVVQEINYPSCFIVYYEIKQRKKRRISLFHRSRSNPSSSRANSTSLRSAYSSFVDTSDNNAKKVVGTTVESLYPVGGAGYDGIWILSQITQNPFQSARNTHIVLRTTQSLLWLAIQAANYRGNYWQSYIKGSLSLEVPSFVLVEFWLEFIVNLPRRKTRFRFINHGSRRSSLSEGRLFSVRYWLCLLFKQISSYSDQDKLKFVENTERFMNTFVNRLIFKQIGLLEPTHLRLTQLK